MKLYSFLINILLAFAISIFSYAEQRTVYVVEISGDIDLGLPPYVSRIVGEAESVNAPIVLRINTFGGRVDAATQIKDALLNAKVPTIAFIDKRAISAGALISISCEKIFMVPGGTIGAATPVDAMGEKTSEKIVSYMRSEMRATAESRNRDPRIAEAMVDEEIEIPNVVSAGKLLTLTTEEALAIGYINGVVNDLNELLGALDLDAAEIHLTRISWPENVLRFLSNPIISGLLITLGLLGLIVEIRTPGWGVPGTIGVLSLALFFGSHYILALADVLDIVLFVLGVGLLIIEIFVTPGFGIAGALGIIFMVVGLFLALAGQIPLITPSDVYRSLLTLAGSLAMTVVALIGLSALLPKSKAWKSLVLSDDQKKEKGYSSHEDRQILVGKEGISITPLRPSGTALIDDERIDVVSDGGFIEANKPVRVVRVEGIRVIVREVKV